MNQKQAKKTTASTDEASIGLDEVLNETMLRAEKIAGEISLVPEASLTGALKIAKGMKLLRGLLTDKVMTEVIELMNTPIGFKTDKDPSKPVWNKKKKVYETPRPYDVNVIRDCFIESLVRGLRPVGNEWNIISGQCYTTKEGLKRLVHEWPGISQIEMNIEVPSIMEGGALFACRVSWVLDDKPYAIAMTKTDAADTRIPVRVNAGMGADAIAGKGERKAWARVYARLSGKNIAEADIDEPEANPEVDFPSDNVASGSDDLFGVCESVEEVENTLKDIRKHANNAAEVDDLVRRAGERIQELEGAA